MSRSSEHYRSTVSTSREHGIIRNRADLLQHGYVGLRSAALDIAEAGILGADPGPGTRNLLSLKASDLGIGSAVYDLRGIRRVVLVGAGKASYPIMRELVGVLGERVSEGLLIVKRGSAEPLDYVDVLEAGHPLPDEASLEAGQRISDLAQRAEKDDLVIAAFTGGATSLVNRPPDSIPLKDLRTANEVLLNAGIDIVQMNTVRRHLCQLKGGHFVRLVQPAHLLCLTLDTAPPGLPWPDLCLPDPTTYSDALAVLDRFDLRASMPDTVVQHLELGMKTPAMETVKSFSGMRHHIESVGSPASACAAAEARAHELGLAAHVVSTTMEGEAREVGIAMAGVANEVLARDRPFGKPCALISGGETTVTVDGSSGRGGPNQEFVLGLALKMTPGAPWACVAVDTDGTDGPTDVAGGVADGQTQARVRNLGAEIMSHLRGHDALTLLELLEDAVLTGPTGTNVMNLRVIVMGADQR